MPTPSKSKKPVFKTKRTKTAAIDLNESDKKIKKQRIKTILKKLAPLYQDNPIEIDYETPFQLIVGTILSAQCTDKRVNMVTKTFFDRLRTPQDFLKLKREELEELIRSTGFFRNKAKNIQGAAHQILENHNGEVPEKMEDLVKLPGFGRKTANVILSALFHKNQGVCVDTHVLRLSNLLELSDFNDAIRVERDLMALTPQKNWHQISHFLILHGRRVCVARKPDCEHCVLAKICPSVSLKS
ncbi:MAG: endonuclease III [Deltaproteobacteria bacterium]|nr:endonuclease III [Deltaproteobacteria bacterium]